MARGYRHIQEYEKEIQEAKARNSLCQRNMAGAEGIEKVYGIFASSSILPKHS